MSYGKRPTRLTQSRQHLLNKEKRSSVSHRGAFSSFRIPHIHRSILTANLLTCRIFMPVPAALHRIPLLCSTSELHRPQLVCIRKTAHSKLRQSLQIGITAVFHLKAHVLTPFTPAPPIRKSCTFLCNFLILRYPAAECPKFYRNPTVFFQESTNCTLLPEMFTFST